MIRKRLLRAESPVSQNKSENKPANLFNRLVHFVDSGGLTQLAGSEIKVMLVLYRFADFQTGDCWPSLATIARLTGMDIRSITRALQALEIKGIITKEQKGRGCRRPTIRKLVFQAEGITGASAQGITGKTEAITGASAPELRAPVPHKHSKNTPRRTHHTNTPARSGVNSRPTGHRSGVGSTRLERKKIRPSRLRTRLEKKNVRPSESSEESRPALDDDSPHLSSEECIVASLADYGITKAGHSLLKTMGAAWCKKLVWLLFEKSHGGELNVSRFARWCAGHPNEVCFDGDYPEADDRDVPAEDYPELDENSPVEDWIHEYGPADGVRFRDAYIADPEGWYKAVDDDDYSNDRDDSR